MGGFRAFAFTALTAILLKLEIIQFKEPLPLELKVAIAIIWILIFLDFLLSNEDIDYEKIREIIREEIKKDGDH